MQKLIWKNALGDEIDLTSGNYGITEWEGFSNASLNIQSQQVPFQDGGVFLDALIEQRELSVTLAMQDNNNLEERYRMRRELIHILNPKLGEGYLIYTNDFISKRIKCVAQIPLFETHNSNDSGTPKASLAWTACEPYWEDLEETEVDLSTSNTTEIINEGEQAIGFEIIVNAEHNNSITINSLTEDTTIKLENTSPLFSNINISTKDGQKKVESITPLLNTINVVNNITTLAKGNGVWVMSGDDGTFRSNDFSSWTNINNIKLKKIIWNDKLALFIGIANANVYTSSDATNWNVTDISTLSTSLNDVCYNAITGETYIAGNVAIVTSDGVNFSIALNESFRVCCYNKYTNEVMMGYSSTKCYVLKNNGQWELQPEVELPESHQSTDINFCCVDDKGNYFLGSFFTGVMLVNSDFEEIGNYFAYGGYSCIFDPVEKNYICGGQVPFSSEYFLWLFRLNNNRFETNRELQNRNIEQIMEMENIDNKIYMCAQSVLYVKEPSNMIQLLSQDSNLGMKLEVGKNYFYLNYINGNEPSATLKYRQKYIGV